jgi:hypothetical protein
VYTTIFSTNSWKFLLTFNSNIDRMLELWIALHPKEAREWFDHDEDAKIPLIPFRKDQYGNYHTAQTIWNPESLGYTYPETQRWKAKYKTNGKFDEDKLAADVAQVVNKKYNSAAAAQRKSALTKEKEEPASKTITNPEAAVEVAPSLHSQIVGEATQAGQSAAGALTGALRDAASAAAGAVKAGISALPAGKSELEFLPKVLKTSDYVANVLFEKYDRLTSHKS